MVEGTDGVLDVHDTLLIHVAGLNHGGTLVEDGLHEGLDLVRGVGEAAEVGLVEDEEEGLAGEEGLDVVEEADLLLHRVATLLREVHKVENAGPEVGEGGDGLHLDGVARLQGVVKNSRGVDDLPPEVLVVHVAHEEGLGGEGVGLDVNVGPGHLVHEAGLAHVRVAGDEEGAGVGVDGGETGHVLPDLVQVGQGVLQALHEGAHPAEAGTLQLLAAVERVAELEEAAVVLGDVVHMVPGRVDLAQGELVVVLVVQDVEQVSVEGVDVLKKRTIRMRLWRVTEREREEKKVERGGEEEGGRRRRREREKRRRRGRERKEKRRRGGEDKVEGRPRAGESR